MKISLIVAMSENRVIGRGGHLPWHLSADLKRFKQLTMGHHLVMGRKTYESLGRVLPGRTSVVLTRQPDYDARGARVASDLGSALQLAAADEEVFIAGGQQVYRLALPLVERMYITTIHACVDGDARFPELEEKQWHLADRQFHAASEGHPYDFSFSVWDRKRGE